MSSPDMVLQPALDAAGLLDRIQRLNVKDQRQYIAEYQVLRTLGAGSFGMVKLCVAPNKEEVAVKMVNMKNVSHDDRQRCETEIRILRSLDHRFICKLSDAKDWEGHKIIAMEYIPCGELYDRLLKVGQFTAEEVASYFMQAHCAVLYLHNQLVYHRDIKLENLLLDRYDRIKLCDFGFAWKSNGHDQRVATNCGSPHYAAPEVVKKESHLPAQAEVWSLGVLLYVLASSSLPFDGPTPENTESRVLAAACPYPEDMGSALRALLGRIFVVKQSERITLTGICDDPWYRSKFARLPADVKQAIEMQISFR